MMHDKTLSRRSLLSSGAIASAACVLSKPASVQAAAAPQPLRQDSFRYCFNTSTIRGQRLSLPEQIDVAARAGYDSIEPWLRDMSQYVESGKSLAELRKRLEDAGMTVDSAIGFAQWIVDDDEQRARALETAKRDMDLVRQLGGRRIAAPPTGATREPLTDLFAIARRYRALLELGERMEVVPQLELWGFSKTISRLGELMFVAVESAHPQACVLPDIYHIYKGGSDFAGLKMISGKAIHVFHMNDYPADPPREKIGDADRVYPGDGVAPLTQVLGDLHRAGFHGALSIELFNRQYWEQDALAVARTALEKMKQAVAKAAD